MEKSNPSPMVLSAADLNELDCQILDLLADGRATPTLVKKRLDQGGIEVSRQYINRRMKRLSEHKHIENVLDTGVYELVSDPRED
jgi:hypothetical protein